MFTGLISFLGGSVFRMIWGEVSSFVNKKQDHSHELEMMKLQSSLEDRRHERDQERVKLQSELGVKEVQIAGDVQIAKSEAEAFVAAIQEAGKPTGIKWVDAWNGCIRPSFATIALLLWGAKIVGQGFTMDEFDVGLLAVIAGFYFADRSLSKRGK